MAKAFSITQAAADAMLNAFGALANSGAVRIYGGPIPADVRTSLDGSHAVLAQATLPAAAFPTLGTSGNNRTLTAGTITGDNAADATGVASFFRIFQSGVTVPVAQGTVDTTDADMIMLDKNIALNGPVNITSIVLSFPMT